MATINDASSEVDMTLVYSSEKLANLENLLLLVLEEGQTNIGEIDVENDDISIELIDKALTFDLLYAILILELKELDDLMCDLQERIVDALHKISTCENSMELVHKLHKSEGLLKISQERVLEMKIQLAKLQMTSFSFKQHEWKYDIVTGIKEELHLTSQDWKPRIQSTEQRRVRRMLEKSLAREMELEKKLKEFKQNEEDYKLKIRLTEQVAACMEEAAEATWARFLEADNTSEVLMGISKDIIEKIQLIHLKLISSTNREEEISSKLRDCVNELTSKEASIEKLNVTVARLTVDNFEVTGLREKVESLEKNLIFAEKQLKDVKGLNEVSEKQIKDMEGEIESLSEKLYAAEGRAGNAEEKVKHLTESNFDLTEELDFLKGSNDSNSKKVSLLEKQLRDLESQLQHSRAFSESNQEQQSMLYSAIWDMETLIDELKQKVAMSESKNESVEERCIMLSAKNGELNKGLEFRGVKMEFMETCLNRVSVEKKASAMDIGVKAGLIMDMVMQLTMERERIYKELISLTKDNKLLREKLLKNQKCASMVLHETGCDDKEFSSSRLDSQPEKTSLESLQIYQVEEKPEASTSANHNTDLVLKPKNYRRIFAFITILVVLLSILAARFFQKNIVIFKAV